MLTAVIIAIATTLAMVVSIIIKPYVKIGKHKLGLYWIITLIGAILMFATRSLSFSDFIGGITANTSVNPLKILTLFLSMTLLSVYLGDAGFFDYIADSVFLKAKGGKLRLFIILYSVVSILTVFTSNDVIILTFTPPICIFARKANISPLPFLIGEFVAANTWSMTLIVGNPTNVYLAGSMGISFFDYLSVMFLPALLGGLVGLVMIILIFKKDLLSPTEDFSHRLMITSPDHHAKIVKTPMVVAVIHLSLSIILLAVSDLIGIEMWVICLCLALSLTLFDLFYDLIVIKSVKPVWRSIKKEPYELIPFVLSMFVIVLALKQSGATDQIANLLITNTKTDGVTFTLLGAISSNLLNNIPMSVLFEKIICSASLPAVYGTVIGSNIGAFISPVGALAGIMWSKILGDYKVKLPFVKFMAFGTAVAIPTLIASIFGLMIML